MNNDMKEYIVLSNLIPTHAHTIKAQTLVHVLLQKQCK